MPRYLRTALLGWLCLFAIGTAAQPPALTVDGPPHLEPTAAQIRKIPSASLSAPLARAGLEMPRRAHVILLGSDDPRARATPHWVAGRAFGSDLIVIFPERIGSYPYGSLEAVVLHELVHLSLNEHAGGRPLPRWFHEGVAVSVESGWGIGSQARLLLAAARGPAIEDVSSLFASGRSGETTTAYLLSAALVEDLRRRHGLTVPAAIATRVARGDSFDRAFFLETGETVNEAAANAWRVYRGLRWLPVLTSSSALWGGILLLASIAWVIRLRRRRQKRWEEDDEDDEEADDMMGEDDEQPPTIH